MWLAPPVITATRSGVILSTFPLLAPIHQPLIGRRPFLSRRRHRNNVLCGGWREKVKITLSLFLCHKLTIVRKEHASSAMA